jgi:ABC-2 type transport system permease protein
MRYLRLVASFVAVSAQQELAYPANFLTGLLNTLINVVTGWLGLAIVFGQVESIHGWSYASALAVLGVYLVVGAVRDLVISPSLDRMAGLDGDLWKGTLDFVLLRPVNTQFLVSLREWRLLSVFDMLLGFAVIGVAGARIELTAGQFTGFVVALLAGLLTLYAVFLLFTSLMFWSPGFLFTWVFNGIFQMARYPVGIYPGFLRLVLTWVIPIGIMTTVPALAFTGEAPGWLLAAVVLFAVAVFAVASHIFRLALRRYASASS